MSDDNSRRRLQYVGRAAEDTQRLLRELLSENEKLRTVATAVETENRRLQEQLNAMSTELERHRHEQSLLRKQLDQIAIDSRKFSNDIAEVEQRNSNLANLYVSSYQLHGTLDREAVLTSIKEIIINLIGSEEVGVYEITEDRGCLELVTSFGIDEHRYRRLSLTEHPIGRLALSGDTYIAGQSAAPAESPRVVVCLPLKLDGRVTGAIVLFSLLAHKQELQELDFELFDLLGSHAATALYCTSLHARLSGAAVS